MNRRRGLAATAAIWCAVTILSIGNTALAQPAVKAALKIGVVDISRLVENSPQASQAKANMDRRFVHRKKNLEAESVDLGKKIDKLQAAGSKSRNSSATDALQSEVRDAQRKLQIEQSQYNADVADAEQAELSTMRKDIRQVIDRYAKQHGYDLILGDSVVYSTSAVDVTDEILHELKKEASAAPG